MEKYRILISDFDSEMRTIESSWVGRRFRLEWTHPNVDAIDKIHYYLSALAENTRKPPAACLALAAKFGYPEAAIEVMTPEDITKADTAACTFAQSDVPTTK